MNVAAQQTKQAGRRFGRHLLIVLTSLCVVLLVPAVLLVRHPNLMIGSGAVNPEAKAISRNPTLANASSVLSIGRAGPVSLQLKPKTVALTFDDGPSEQWTREVQAVLDEYGVPGTFFVIGSNVTRYPDVVRDLAKAGHEIGNHSYTHPEMSTLAGWQMQEQVQLTDRVVLGITGERPKAYRPPYSGGSAYLSPQEYAAAREALGNTGHLLVLSDRLPRDFDEASTVEEVAADAMPVNGASAVITMHDAGGDRSKTIAALRILIPRLKADGYSFARASDIVDQSVVPQAISSTGEKRLDRMLIAATSLVTIGFRILWIVAIAGVILGLLRIMTLLYFTRRYRRTRDLIAEHSLPYRAPVTVIIPAYNEEVGIAEAVLSIANNDYADVRIIVVDDGSTDATAQIVELLRLENVTLLRQENAGKSAALNAGIAAATTEIVVLVDGDTIFDANTIHDVVQPFRNPTIGAVAGNAKVGNRSKLITRMQHVEYTVASELERRMWGVFGVSPCVPGAIGAFRKTALVEVGCLSQDTLAEDSDLTVALARAGWRVDYVAAARAWTEAPSTWSGLLRQRRRWSYGVLQVMAKHRHALVERGPGGRLARAAFLYQLLVSYALAIFAPAIDIVLLHDVIFQPNTRVATLSVWAALNTVNAGVNMYALRLDGERLRTGWWAAFAQQFIYRQVLYIAALRSIAAAIVGTRLPWQTPRRVGGVVAATRGTPMDAVANRRPIIDLTAYEPTLVLEASASDGLLARLPFETVASWPLRILNASGQIDLRPKATDGWSAPLSIGELLNLLGGDAPSDMADVEDWLAAPRDRDDLAQALARHFEKREQRGVTTVRSLLHLISSDGDESWDRVRVALAERHCGVILAAVADAHQLA